MQRTMLIVAPMFAALLTFAAVRSLAVRTPPQAFISPDNQRVVAKDGTDHLIAIYPIKNQGGKDLVLGDFRTSCGCSSASVDPKILRPGQSGQIRVTGEPPQSGERDVIITLASNSHPHGELKLGLTLVGPEKKFLSSVAIRVRSSLKISAWAPRKNSSSRRPSDRVRDLGSSWRRPRSAASLSS